MTVDVDFILVLDWKDESLSEANEYADFDNDYFSPYLQGALTLTLNLTLHASPLPLTLNPSPFTLTLIPS